MTEIEAIRERHSVRNYLSTPISQFKMEKLKNKIAECNAIGNLHLQFVEEAGNTFNRLMNKAMGLGSAPSVIACVGPDDETLDERIGYYGEKIVLYAQTLGLNTCWAGTFNAKKVKADIKEGERLSIVIAIGEGANQGKQHPSKSPEKVIKGKKEKPYWFNFGVELALLAPTAVNQQKFEIELLDNGEVSIVDKGGFFSKVNLGIVKYHFEVGEQYVKNTTR